MTVKFPNMLVALTQKAPTGPSQGTVMDHFGFKVRSMPEMLAAVRAAGYTVQSEFTGAEGFPNAYFLGPDGLRVEMQEDKTLTAKARRTISISSRPNSRSCSTGTSIRSR